MAKKRKLSAYNIFLSEYKKHDPSASFTEVAEAWKIAKKNCSSCNPGKSKTKKPKKTVFVPEKSVFLPGILGLGLGASLGIATRFYDYEIPIPVPFNKLSILAPSIATGLGVIAIILSPNTRAFGVGLVISGTATALVNYFYPLVPTARQRLTQRRLLASRRIPIRRMVAKVPSSAVKKPMFTSSSRVGANGSDLRPVKMGCNGNSAPGDVPIKPGGFLHPVKLGCNGSSSPSDLPLRYPNRQDRIETTPTYISGETILA